MILKRVASRKGVVVFMGENGGKYLLKAVDRDYKKKKAPEYYLMKAEKDKNKYISGLFATEKEDVYSLDIVDKMGLKVMYEFVINSDGAELKRKVS